jgi:hypothetical protein
MSRKQWVRVAMMAVIALGIGAGCSDSDDDDASPSDSYAGTWVGQVCGRGLTMTLSQNGTTLSGSYMFTGPTFNDTCAGTVSSVNTPATATLRSTGGHDFWFEVTFTSYHTMVGGYYKSGVKVCDVTATK